MSKAKHSWHKLAPLWLALQLLAACQGSEADETGRLQDAAISQPSAADETGGLLQDGAISQQSDTGGADDPCLSRCPFEGNACVEPPGFDATLAAWQASCPPGPAMAVPFLVEARCADGKRLLTTGRELGSQLTYFDADGTFLAFEWMSDSGHSLQCPGAAYWPDRIVCGAAKVVRVFCGTLFAVGDELQF